jgi:hypothetical protein
MKQNIFKERDLKASLAALLKSHFPKDRLKKEREAMISQ